MSKCMYVCWFNSVKQYQLLDGDENDDGDDEEEGRNLEQQNPFKR